MVAYKAGVFFHRNSEVHWSRQPSWKAKEKTKGGGAETAGKGGGVESREEVRVRVTIWNPSTSSFKSVLSLFQLSGSINVQDGGITLFPQCIALQNMRALQADLLLKRKDVLGLLPAGFGKKSFFTNVLKLSVDRLNTIHVMCLNNSFSLFFLAAVFWYRLNFDSGVEKLISLHLSHYLHRVTMSFLPQPPYWNEICQSLFFLCPFKWDVIGRISRDGTGFEDS